VALTIGAKAQIRVSANKDDGFGIDFGGRRSRSGRGSDLRGSLGSGAPAETVFRNVPSIRIDNPRW
jgi:hypothetical protein